MTTGFSINSAGSGQAEEKAPAAERMTGSQAIIRTLELLGVTDVFGLPGGAILPTYDPLMDSSKINHILVRHEQGAGHAAQGYATSTGKVGVCIATSAGRHKPDHRDRGRQYGLRSAGSYHRSGFHQTSGHRRLPGSRRGGYDHADYQALLHDF